MTLAAGTFIQRFLLHILPDGFHRIRHYGLLTTGRRVATIERCRELIAAQMPASAAAETDTGPRVEQDDPHDNDQPPCPCCGGHMILVERFAPGSAPRTIFQADTS